MVQAGPVVVAYVHRRIGQWRHLFTGSRGASKLAVGTRVSALYS